MADLLPASGSVGFWRSLINSVKSLEISWKLVAGCIWLIFSVTLACWWMIFGLKQIDRIAAVAINAPAGVTSEIARHNFMLMSEGTTLILLLLIGGAALLYYIATELRRNRRLREFFATFTHELKTSLASVRLQAESLEEDLVDPNQARLVKRLVKETVRLELQLENSLLLASPEDTSRLLIEAVDLQVLFKSMAQNWPDLDVEVNGEATVGVDRRAIESIFKNILQNAVIHGRADQVHVHIARTGSHATVRLQDNGRGFQGDRDKLGEMFGRHASTSGSGIGLYLSTKLAQAMRGDLRFCDTNEGFCVEVVLPEMRVPSRNERLLITDKTDRQKG